jgi:hypothetical protein
MLLLLRRKLESAKYQSNVKVSENKNFIIPCKIEYFYGSIAISDVLTLTKPYIDFSGAKVAVSYRTSNTKICKVNTIYECIFPMEFLTHTHA